MLKDFPACTLHATMTVSAHLSCLHFDLYLQIHATTTTNNYYYHDDFSLWNVVLLYEFAVFRVHLEKGLLSVIARTSNVSTCNEYQRPEG